MMISYLFQLLLSWLSIALVTRGAVSWTGMTLLIGDVPYFIPPRSVATFKTRSAGLSGKDFMALTVVETDKSSFSEADLTSATQTYAAKDDVWQNGFLECTSFRMGSSLLGNDFVQTCMASRVFSWLFLFLLYL